MAEVIRPTIGDEWPDEKRCPAVVRLSWTYSGSPQRRERIRCTRRRGHVGNTHVAYLYSWNVPWDGHTRVVMRWVT